MARILKILWTCLAIYGKMMVFHSYTRFCAYADRTHLRSRIYEHTMKLWPSNNTATITQIEKKPEE